MSSYSAAVPSLWEHDAPSFDLGISPPTSQPTPPTCQPTFLPSAEPSFTAAEVYKTPEKEKEITEELKEKCYHWITHVKETKDSANEYDPLFILKHQGNFEGLRHHFMPLIPGQHAKSTVVNTHCMILIDMKCPRFQKDIYCVPTNILMFMLGNHGVKYIDPKTKKVYRFDVD
ncbi:hypothetical protein Ahy_B05g076391 isoform B [Arachis hypogaea]|uniref:Uncharacterized protein n=1 Tax=Arachis hypogaea TaxID=3818 RepID=A0A444Z372_ARAHY|nr:hypothetical protein Ahy_B05g076391 isoform B [Arachis hypogaea]